MRLFLLLFSVDDAYNIARHDAQREGITMKQRLLLCLLLCFCMLYYALPQLSIRAEGPEGVFAVSWLCMLLFAIAGNLSSILYTPKKRKAIPKGKKQRLRERIY